MSIEKSGDTQNKPEGSEKNGSDRRDFLGRILMGGGILVSYGTLAVEGGLFLLPPDKEVRTRQLFIGALHQFPVGQVKNTYDLHNNTILIKRLENGGDSETGEKTVPVFQAFSSVCPHLGCKVHWQEKEQHFLCPCHNGIFDAEGVAISGPPAKAHQSLTAIPVHVDRESGRVYIEVKGV